MGVSTQEFQQLRPLLFSIAYRMLGSVAEAEDVVQDAFLRSHEAQEVDSPKAYLSTVVTRLCIDRYKSARTRRETYVGPWLPEPLPTGDAPAPERSVDRLESVSMAFLVLLESLGPVERAVFLLRQVFDHDYAEIAAIVGKSEAACRQVFHRASEAVSARKPRFQPSPEHGQRLAASFWAACQGGDLEALKDLLEEEITLTSDGGGKRAAALRVVRGRDAVARCFLGLMRKAPEDLTVEALELNGSPGVVVRQAGEIINVILLEAGEAGILAIRGVRNPDKLGHLG